jgi:hypothetical protein
MLRCDASNKNVEFNKEWFIKLLMADGLLQNNLIWYSYVNSIAILCSTHMIFGEVEPLFSRHVLHFNKRDFLDNLPRSVYLGIGASLCLRLAVFKYSLFLEPTYNT